MKLFTTLSLPTIVSLLLACALHAHAETDAPSAGVIRRAGEPDCVRVTDDDKVMERAVQTAQETVSDFIAVLRSPKDTQSRFAIKKPFVEGDSVEHIWLNDVRFDGHRFHGKVDNEPVDIKGVSLGEDVAVWPNEISDWMYIQDGRLVGGYTISAMCRTMSPAEKKQFEEDAHCRVP